MEVENSNKNINMYMNKHIVNGYGGQNNKFSLLLDSLSSHMIDFSRESVANRDTKEHHHDDKRKSETPYELLCHASNRQTNLSGTDKGGDIHNHNNNDKNGISHEEYKSIVDGFKNEKNKNIDYTKYLEEQDVENVENKNSEVIVNKKVEADVDTKAEAEAETQIETTTIEMKTTAQIYEDLTQLHNSNDPLFWLLFKHFHRLDIQDMNFSYTNERDEKYKIVERIQQQKKEIKKMKHIDMEKSLGLLSSIQKIDTMTAILIAFVLQKNIAVVYGASLCFLNIFNETDTEIYTVEKRLHPNSSGEFKYHIHIKYTEKELRERYYIFTNILKPIKSESSYKLEELKNIATFLRIPCCVNGKNLRKKELYTTIKACIEETIL